MKLGHQTLLELYACKQDLLNDQAFIQKTLIEAAEVAKATIVKQYFHQFSPYGISGTLIITESHINIHTWPEHNFAAVDFFTCDFDMKIDDACAYLKKVFEAKEVIKHDHKRGSMALIQKLGASQTQNHHQ